MNAAAQVNPTRTRAWFSGPDGKPRYRRYLLATLLGTVVIWTSVLMVTLVVPKSYSVDFSLILPSNDADARVDLKETGQAYATSRSTYDAKTLDPRVNYKQIILSPNVLDSAADEAKIDPRAFGEPRVKLIDQSSVMQLRVSGASPQGALAKARALHRAFDARLNELRQDELAQREQAVEQAIRNSRKKLNVAQADLVEFKVGAQIVSDKQLDEMAGVSTALERRKAELSQKRAAAEATATSLAGQLGIPARIAGWTLTLQGDAVFLEHFKQFAASSASVAGQSHKWDEAHPKVRESSAQQESALDAMLQRARAVLAVSLEATELRSMALVLQDRSRDQLLRELVAAQASADAAAAEIAEIDRQSVRIAARMPRLAREAARLDELQRRVNFSEALFTGAAGKPEVNLSNVFASYPMVQVLVAPALPRAPSSPRFAYIAAGALVASACLWVALCLAWLRHKT